MSSPLRWILDLIDIHGKRQHDETQAVRNVSETAGSENVNAVHAPRHEGAHAVNHNTAPTQNVHECSVISEIGEGGTPMHQDDPTHGRITLTVEDLLGHAQLSQEPRGPVKACPYVPSSPSDLNYSWSEAQQQYFRYFAKRFGQGEAIEADLGYVERLSADVARDANTFADLAASWERLRDAYPLITSNVLEGRVVASRLVLGNYIFDGRMRSLRADEMWHPARGWMFFDLAVHAGQAPCSADLDALVMELVPEKLRWRDRTNGVDALGRLRAVVQPDPLLCGIVGATPRTVSRDIFSDLRHIDRLARRDKGGPLHRVNGGFGVRAQFRSYFFSKDARNVVLALFEQALTLVQPPASKNAIDLPPTIASGEKPVRIPIRRRSGVPAIAFRSADTLDGLRDTARVALGWEGVVMLAVVLVMSDVKPWIEGQIALSRDLRAACDRVLVALDVPGGIGPLKRGFHQLLCGSRAPWMLDCDVPAEHTALKMQGSRARFVRNLQHELIGSAARTQVIDDLAHIAAERLDRPYNAVRAALSPQTVIAEKE